MQVTVNDFQRIMGILDITRFNNEQVNAVDRLKINLKRAILNSQVTVLPTVVTMNSRVLVRDQSSQRQATITVTYPHQSDPVKGKISVFSPIGVALLGAKEGDIISWEIPDGVGYFLVERVLYQPEASGHYHL